MLINDMIIYEMSSGNIKLVSPESGTERLSHGIIQRRLTTVLTLLQEHSQSTAVIHLSITKYMLVKIELSFVAIRSSTQVSGNHITMSKTSKQLTTS